MQRATRFLESLFDNHRVKKARINDPEQAAIKIQTAYRRHLAQQKFGIPFFKSSELTRGQVIPDGNDPYICIEDKYKPNGDFALVGNSGMRSIEIACQLAAGNNFKAKIIIIDINVNVYRFWRMLKEYFKTNTNQDDVLRLANELFMQREAVLVFPNCYGIPFDVEKRNRGITFLKALIEKYSFDSVRNMILNLSVIPQSWNTPGLFKKIKNILDLHKIDNVYAYASNILGFVDYLQDDLKKMYSDTQHTFYIDDMLENITSLNPKLVIHTDFCKHTKSPHKVYYLENNAPDFVKDQVLEKDYQCRYR